jgi:hypothetical protein
MKKLILVAALLVFAGTAAAQAQQGGFGYRGVGPRFGLSVDPDQVHVGMHVDFGDVARQLRFQPNFEMGFGDGLTTGAFNFDMQYVFRKSWDVWAPYLGGGLGVNHFSRQNDGVPGASRTEEAVNLMGGIEKYISARDRLFFEAKVGLIEAPDFKLTMGWTFGS